MGNGNVTGRIFEGSQCNNLNYDPISFLKLEIDHFFPPALFLFRD